jgi:hypothetical protein
MTQPPRFLGIDRYARRHWRCVHCKRVQEAPQEPERCSGDHCLCRTFAECD